MSVETTVGYGEISRARDSIKALRTLADIRAGARQFATDGEREQLRLWSGWGPLAPLFKPKTDSWAQIAGDAAKLLSERDLHEGMQGTYNAFFTPAAVATEMWALLGRLGFDGGKVAELGCGAGAFLATAPDGVQMVGVERDPTSAAIARLLNPQHTVIGSPLEEAQLSSDFGAVIGNVPFGDVKIYDPSAPAKSGVTGSLHVYFLWRALMCLAPGGMAVLLTSRFTMDGVEDSWKAAIERLGDFVGAVRLPSGGLEGGTEAVADIVVFRRKVPGHDSRGEQWRTVDRETFGWSVPVNTYFVDRPGRVVGTMAAGQTTQYGLSLVVTPDERHSAAEGVRLAGSAVVRDAESLGLRWVRPPAADEFDAAAAQAVSAEGWLEGSFHLKDRAVYIVKDGRAHQIPAPGRELTALVGLRDAVEQLVDMEARHELTDAQVDVQRKVLAKLYRAYVAKFGWLRRGTKVSKGVDAETGVEEFGWRKPPMGGFRNDPGWALVAALELWDDEDETATPAPILSARQNRPVVHPEFTTDAKTALAWCLDRLGHVDLAYIADRLNLPDDADESWVTDRLGDAVYQEPSDASWVTGEEYLSGDVRDKLKTAQTAAIVEPRYQRNVDALVKVQPKWLGPGEIIAVIGTPWMPASDMKRFCLDMMGFGGGAKVRHLRESNRWEVDAAGSRSSVAASQTWGTRDIDFYKLLELALNGKVPNVHFPKSGKKDEKATLEAVQMQQRIKERFRDWVWEDAERSGRLVHLYNTRYNCLVTRQYDGSHITIEGLAADWASKLYDHQRSFIARGIASPATLCAHPVGAGKTATMTCLAMKLGELSLVSKPMLIVPNHLIEQATTAAMQMFPGKKILGASAETISASRRAFTARVATQHWDLIIVTHSAFDRMPVHPATKLAYLEDRTASLRSSLVEASEDGESKGRTARNMQNRLSDMEAEIELLRGRAPGKTIEELEAELDKSRARAKGKGDTKVKDAAKKIDRRRAGDKELLERRHKDSGCTFEQLGVSWVGIDEAHNYKNLAVACYNEGFTISPSKRASHVDMILRWLSKRGSGRYASLFTGTPVSNTMLELYVMMQYLMPWYLDEIGLGSADSWVAAYAEMVTKVGVTVDGSKFELQTRPARFVNAPELRVLFSTVADVRSADDLGIKRPEEVCEVVTVEPTSKQAVFSGILVSRSKALKGVRFPEPGSDNMLKVCNDGRWMATDPTLVGIRDDEPGKLHACAEKIIEMDRRFPGKVQLVFCDIGTPNDRRGTQTYGRLRRLLTEMGMPIDKVEFVHSAKTDLDKAAQFRRARQSKLRVLMGSTGKLGTGTNVQDNVIAMHHLDAPYTPASVEQRDGRGIRHGNQNERVFNFRYVTARTFDAYLWQLLVRKLTFISQLMSGKLDRSIEDCATDQLLSFSAVQASATGQPLLMEREELAAEVNDLRSGQATHKRKQANQRLAIPDTEREIAKHEALAASWAAIGAAELPEFDAEELGGRLHEAMTQWRYRHEPVTVGGLSVTFGSWMSRVTDETHPELRVDGGAGWVTDRLFSNYKPETVVKHLLEVVGMADHEQGQNLQVAERLRAEVAEMQKLLLTPYDKADELTAKQARLDQIEAELRTAAVGYEDAESTVESQGEDEEGGHDKVQLTPAEQALMAEIEAGALVDVDQTMVAGPRLIPAQPAPVQRDRAMSKHSGAEVDLPILAGESEPVAEFDPVAAMEALFAELSSEYDQVMAGLAAEFAALDAAQAVPPQPSDAEREMAEALALLGV